MNEDPVTVKAFLLDFEVWVDHGERDGCEIRVSLLEPICQIGVVCLLLLSYNILLNQLLKMSAQV